MKLSNMYFIIPAYILLFLVPVLFSFYHGSFVIPKFDYFDSNTIVTKVFATEVSNNTDNSLSTNTPIKHVVIIFQENIAFDHYFGTYPIAKNPANEPHFSALPNTPSTNGLTEYKFK